jgi:hypothetical protein
LNWGVCSYLSPWISRRSSTTFSDGINGVFINK